MKKLESTLVNMVGVLVCVALIMGGILAKSAGKFDGDSLPLLCAMACEIHGCAGAIWKESTAGSPCCLLPPVFR